MKHEKHEIIVVKSPDKIEPSEKIYKTFWQSEEAEYYHEGDKDLTSMDAVNSSLKYFLINLLKKCETDEELEDILAGKFGVAENNIVIDLVDADSILSEEELKKIN